MSVHLLKFNMQSGEPSIETFRNAEALQGGHPPGQRIASKEDLDSLKAKYAGHSWVMELLSDIDETTLGG